MQKLVDRFPIKSIGFSDIEPVRAGYQHCEPGYSFGPVIRDSWTVQYVLSGQGTLEKNGKVLTAHAGQCFLLRPGEQISLCADIRDPWLYIWVGFRTRLTMPKAMLTQDVLDAPEFEPLFLEIADCNRPQNRPLALMLVSYICRLMLLFHQVSSGPAKSYTRPEAYVDQACARIHNSFPTISVQQLAQELQLNRCYLSRIFKESTGISLQKYITNTRLQAARELLVQGHTVAEAAAMMGYADIASLSRAFKQYFKMSPMQYKKAQEDPAAPHAPAL